MEHIPKADRVEYKNSEACTAYEYEFAANDINAALIDINGRYPESGWAVNIACNSLVHVIAGSGAVLFECEQVDIQEDSQLYIEKTTKYAFEGHMKILYAATPKWTPEQARNIL